MIFLLLMTLVFSFSVYLAIEAMKHGMCEKRWFIAAMCFGPLIWPMFNVKRQMQIRQQLLDGNVRLKV